jgi:hypothetical protein
MMINQTDDFGIIRTVKRGPQCFGSPAETLSRRCSFTPQITLCSPA